MAYQSIFSGGNFSRPTKANPLSVGFQPGQYAQVNAVIAAKNPATYKDIPSLNAALKAGYINKDQWMSRYKQINPTVNTPAYSRANTVSALGGALNKVFVQAPVAVAKAIPQSEAVVAKGVARVLPGGTADVKAQQQNVQQANAAVRQAIIDKHTGKLSPEAANKIIYGAANNASAGAKQQAATVKAMPTRGQLAAGFSGTAADILTLGSLKAAKGTLAASKAVRTAGQVGGFAAAGGLGTGAAGGTKKQIIENAAIAGALPVLGRVGQVFKAGPEELIRNVKTNQLVKAGRVGYDKPVNVPVRGGGDVNLVDVRTPAKIPVAGASTADKINVRTPVRMTEAQFTKEFNGLNKAYERETKQLEAANATLPPKQVQALSDALESKYQGHLNDLVDRYQKPPLSAPVAPKPIKLPKEPKTITQAVNKTLSNREVAPVKVATKQEPLFQEKAPAKEANARVAPETPTTKVSGSALKSEQRAVEANLTTHFENKAGYESGSYKTEAEKAVRLVNEDPVRASRIARGLEAGDNTIHEVAVARAVEQKALKEGDTATLTALAQSSRHTATSEAAQRLGAEGYAVDHRSPVQIIKDLRDTRIAQAEKRGKNVDKAVSSELKAIREAVPKRAPSKQDWSSFIEELRCG